MSKGGYKIIDQGGMQQEITAMERNVGC